MDSFAVSNVSSCLRFYWPLFFCLHDFPFVNPFWLPPITFLSFLCLATVSRTISSTFQGIRVRLKSLWFPESFSLCLKIGTSLAFLSPQEPLPSAQAFASDWAWSHNDTGLPPSAFVVVSYQVPCSLLKGFLIWSSLPKGKSLWICTFLLLLEAWKAGLTQKDWGEEGTWTFSVASQQVPWPIQ